MLYNVLKFIHVASIAVWFGGLVTLLTLNRLLIRAGDNAAVQAIGRQGQGISARLFLPAVLVTLITGIGMVQVGQLGFGTLWIVWGTIGLVVSMFIGSVLTGGAARKLAAQAARGEVDAAGIARVQRRILTAAIVNMLLLLSIIWAMVAKPS
jgi:uncharacterized membrane protein